MIEHLFRHVSRYHIPLEPCKSDDVKFIAEKLIEATNHFFHLLVFVTKVLLSLCAAVHICLTINFEFTKVLLTNVGVHSLSNLVESLLCSVAWERDLELLILAYFVTLYFLNLVINGGYVFIELLGGKPLDIHRLVFESVVVRLNRFNFLLQFRKLLLYLVIFSVDLFDFILLLVNAFISFFDRLNVSLKIHTVRQLFVRC